MQPWGLITDPTEKQIFDLYTEGYSVFRIAKRLGLDEFIVREIVRSDRFAADFYMLKGEQLAGGAEIDSPETRVAILQDLAIDVLAEEIRENGKQKVSVAIDILDRGGRVPRKQKIENTGTFVPGDELRALASVLREVRLGHLSDPLELPANVPS